MLTFKSFTELLSLIMPRFAHAALFTVWLMTIHTSVLAEEEQVPDDDGIICKPVGQYLDCDEFRKAKCYDYNFWDTCELTSVQHGHAGEVHDCCVRRQKTDLLWESLKFGSNRAFGWGFSTITSSGWFVLKGYLNPKTAGEVAGCVAGDANSCKEAITPE